MRPMETSTSTAATSRALKARPVRKEGPSPRRTGASSTGSRAVRCRGTERTSVVNRPETGVRAGVAGTRLAAAAVALARLRRAVDDLELLEAAPGADRHAGERRLGELHGHLRLVAEPVGEACEERAASGQHDAAVHDVGRELGRRLVERGLDRVDDLADGLVEGAPHLLAREDDGLRQAGEHVAPADLGRDLLRELPRGADLELQLLRGLLADEELVLLLDVAHDRVVHLVPADTDRLGDDDAAERDDRDF